MRLNGGVIMAFLWRHWGVAVLVALIACVLGCTRTIVKPRPAPVTAPKANLAIQRMATKKIMLQQLLRQAERALARGRLSVPAHDNAFDKFKAALIIDKNSGRAKSGLDAVLLGMVASIRENLSKGQLARAGAQTQVLERYFPKAALTRAVTAELEQGHQALAQQQLLNNKRIDSDDSNRHPVPLGFIRSDDAAAAAWFKALALSVREADASVLIHARSDSEGRWLYKALRKPVPGYLVRGDIRINKTPSITLLESLSE